MKVPAGDMGCLAGSSKATSLRYKINGSNFARVDRQTLQAFHFTTVDILEERL